MVKQTVEKAHHDNLQNEAFLDLFDLWRQRRKNRQMPSRRDFSFNDFRPWLGSLTICRYLEDSQEFVADLFGTNIAEWAKLDLTNHTYGPEHFGKATREILRPFFASIELQSPVLAIAYSERANGKLTRLILPCSDDQEKIDRLIIALKPDAVFQDYLLDHSLISAMEE